MGGPLQGDIISDFSALEKLSPEWDRLFRLDQRLDIFQNFAWMRTWWRSFGGNYELWTAAARENGRLAGLLPLAKSGRVLRFLGHSASDYNTLLAEPDREGEVLAACLRALLARPGWNRLLLENVPEQSRLAAAVEELPRELRARVSVEKRDPCPVLTPGDGKQEFAAVLRKDKLRKMVRYLGRLGELRFRHLTPEEAPAHLQTFVRQHVRRSAVLGRWSTFLRPEVLGFYDAMVRDPELAGELRFSVLEVVDRPVAYHLGFYCKRKFIYFKPTFDVDISELSPGQVLFWHLLDDCQSQEVDEFDFGQGGESYKYRFSNGVRHNLQIEMFALGARAALAKAAQRTVERGREAIRSWPELEKRLQAIDDGRAGESGPAALWRSFRHTAYGREKLLLGRVTAAASDERLEAREVTLGELADLACEFPKSIPFARLQQARDHLKQQAPRLLSAGGRPRHVIWTATAAEIPLPGDLPPRPLDREALVLFHWWSLAPEAGGADAPAVLAWLAGTAAANGMEAWAFLPAASARATATAFRPALRLTGVRHWDRTRWRQTPLR